MLKLGAGMEGPPILPSVAIAESSGYNIRSEYACVLPRGKLAHQQRHLSLVYRDQIKVHAPFQWACSSPGLSVHPLGGDTSSSVSGAGGIDT